MIETVPSGTVLYGRYRIERVLGSGGFGHVYLAIDLATNQQYAVKEYLVTGTSGQEQLKHEATVLRNLHHASLPAFHDAFIERGRYYVVINYIEGNDLTDLVRMARQRNEVIAINRILSWVLSICDAVLFLHRQQPIVIHRDIKPDNIRITPSGTAVLVDLGNAKAAADGSRTLFFIRHQGTPGYAPPEQYPGGSGTDARSDIYALGGTLYFALTMVEPPSVSIRNQSIQQGQPNLPTLQEHLANNPPEESPEAIAARQFRLGVNKPGKPVPRHSRHIAQLGMMPPELLKRLNYIIQKSMALKPRDRYQNVADFANDLHQILKAFPPPPPPPRPARPVDPHSTQPDLPGLYDALMEGKEQAAQQGQEPPGTQPMPPNAGTAGACPRCGASLAPRATFCPRCGTALGGPTAMQQREKKPASSPNVKDISAEQTLLIRPSQAKQAIATYPSRPQQVPPPVSVTTGPASVPPQHISGQQGTLHTPPAFSASPVPHPSAGGSFSGGQQGTPASGGSSASGGSGLMLVVLIAVIIILVIIALVIIFVILPNRQQSQAVLSEMANIANVYDGFFA